MIERIFNFGLLLLLALAVSAILAFPIWLLWNILMPEIFGLTVITYKQAFGLLLLVRFLNGEPTAKSS